MEQLCSCSRLYRFEASHYERLSRNYNDPENEIVYGKAIYPHGHNYELTLNIFGEVSRQTGMVLELGTIDDYMKEYLLLLDHKNFSAIPRFAYTGMPMTQEFIASQIFQDLFYKLAIPHLQSIRFSENNGESQVFLHKDEPMKVYHTKVFTFNAQHSLSSTALTATENAAVFGKCIRPHGHDYTLKLTISGTPNERTNKLLIEHVFEKSVCEVLERFDYADLNTLSEFSGRTPATTENIIRVLYNLFYDIIEKFRDNKYMSNDVELAFLELQETNRNRFLYFGKTPPTQATTEASSQ